MQFSINGHCFFLGGVARGQMTVVLNIACDFGSQNVQISCV